jgi:hypothetical protein
VVNQGVGCIKILSRESDIKAATCEKPNIIRLTLFFLQFDANSKYFLLFVRNNKGAFAHFLFVSETLRYIARNICVTLLYKVRSKHLNYSFEQSPFEASVLFCRTRPVANISIIILYKVVSQH